MNTQAAPAPKPRAENVSTPPPPNPQVVPSPATPPGGPAPKTAEDWAIEHLKAFETLAGNGSPDRFAERLAEIRDFDPDEPEDFRWDGLS